LSPIHYNTLVVFSINPNHNREIRALVLSVPDHLCQLLIMRINAKVIVNLGIGTLATERLTHRRTKIGGKKAVFQILLFLRKTRKQESSRNAFVQ